MRSIVTMRRTFMTSKKKTKNKEDTQVVARGNIPINTLSAAMPPRSKSSSVPDMAPADRLRSGDLLVSVSSNPGHPSHNIGFCV